MNRRLQAISLVLAVWAAGVSANPVIILDAGHEPSKPGATGRCFKKEVEYNDAAVSALSASLSGYKLVLTRTANAEVRNQREELRHYLDQHAQPSWDKHKSLLARAALANAQQADLFISIHHDSTVEQQQVTDATLCNGQRGKKLRDAFKQRYQIGFNLFINDKAPEPQRSLSLKIARLIGRRLIQSARTASNYHQDDCKSCRIIDGDLGIWHQDLAVLRYTRMPAVLIEVGNLIDIEDEALISTSDFQRRFAHIIKAALDDYFSGSMTKNKYQCDVFP